MFWEYLTNESILRECIRCQSIKERGSYVWFYLYSQRSNNFHVPSNATQDQDMVMQDLYDKGYNGKEIAKFFQLSEASVYNRIKVHRGCTENLFKA